jgi:hypothetical protein
MQRFFPLHFAFFSNFFILLNDMNDFVNIDDEHYKNVSVFFHFFIFCYLINGGTNED